MRDTRSGQAELTLKNVVRSEKSRIVILECEQKGTSEKELPLRDSGIQLIGIEGSCWKAVEKRKQAKFGQN